MRTNTYIRFENVCKKIKGYVGTKELLQEGYSNRQIAVLTEEGYLEKICHGYYWIKQREYRKPKDYKCIEACLSAPRAVICMKSALYYQDVIEEEPKCLSVATERTDRSLLKVEFPVKRHYFSEKIFGIGVEKRKTEFGCYNIYDIERSICDVIRLQSDTIEIVYEMSKNERQYERLLRYAELLNIKKLR